MAFIFAAPSIASAPSRLIVRAVEQSNGESDGRNSSSKAGGFGTSVRVNKKKATARSGSRSGSGISRRQAPDKPLIAQPLAPGSPSQSPSKLESAFVLFLVGLLIGILVEGLVLAASGFLPDEWDDFIVKVLYPTYTPEVVLFLACAAGYGLFKYLGSQKQS